MKKWLIVGAVLAVLFFGAKTLTQQETATREYSTVPSKIAHQEMAQKIDDQKIFSSSFATAKELTPAQKKLEALGFYPDKFQSIQVKAKTKN